MQIMPSEWAPLQIVWQHGVEACWESNNSGMVSHTTLTSLFHDEVISVDLAKQLLENRPGSRALVLSMECYGCSCRCSAGPAA